MPRPIFVPCVTGACRGASMEVEVEVRGVDTTASVSASFDACVARILGVRASVDASRAALVAISGIDGSGKGYVSRLLEESLRAEGLRVALLNVDGWLNLPSIRFSATNSAEHFYRNAIRFQPMFRDLVIPLRDRRSIRLEADFAEETASAYRRHLYAFDDVDVILLEGIYLLKRDFRPLYDLALWIECSFETALERAIARAQEGLPPAETARAYRTLYFPAQERHFREDAPRESCDLLLVNDPRGGTRP